MTTNGLTSSSFHVADFDKERLLEFKLDQELESGYLSSAEWAARRYLQLAQEAETLPAFTKPDLVDGSRMSLHLKSTEKQPLTGNKTLKFRQRINHISVYGSQILVELDSLHNLISLDAKISKAQTSEALAGISPREVINIAKEIYRISDWPKDNIPLLYHYYSGRNQSWTLAYQLKDLVAEARGIHHHHNHHHHHPDHDHLPDVVDLIVDANTGEVIEELPRIACIRQISEGLDELGVMRNFPIMERADGVLVMKDEKLRVETYDFGFSSILFEQNELPGKIISKLSEWQKSGVSAHHNTCKVAGFFKNVLKRNGLDNKGMPYVSSVNCINMKLGTDLEWKNAAWFNGQIVYGQEKLDGVGYRSYASALDIVAHEITHGVTDSISRLEYRGETGALNESYADVFGVIISNWEEPDISCWDWRLGEELSLEFLPLRDMSDPAAQGQPVHMKAYVNTPIRKECDYGGVHLNSGIHNKAAYLLMNAKGEQGRFLLTKEEIAYLFYLSLTKLAAQDGFSESWETLLNSAKSLFMSNQSKQKKVIIAIDAAFEEVGVTRKNQEVESGV